MASELILFLKVVLKVLFGGLFCVVVILVFRCVDFVSGAAYPSGNNKPLEALKAVKEWSTILMFFVYLGIEIYNNFFRGLE